MDPDPQRDHAQIERSREVSPLSLLQLYVQAFVNKYRVPEHGHNSLAGRMDRRVGVGVWVRSGCTTGTGLLPTVRTMMLCPERRVTC